MRAHSEHERGKHFVAPSISRRGLQVNSSHVGGTLAMRIHRLKGLGLEMSLTELHRKELCKTGIIIIIPSL